MATNKEAKEVTSSKSVENVEEDQIAQLEAQEKSEEAVAPVATTPVHRCINCKHKKDEHNDGVCTVCECRVTIPAEGSSDVDPFNG